MAQIVAAEFKEFAQAESVVEALQDQGFASSQLTTFYLNAPGQHAKLPIGGDRYEDPAAAAAGPGALKGAALGSVAGLALGAAAVAGGIAAGAYAGSLAGAVGSLGKDEPRAARPIQRPAGVVVAVLAPTPVERERAASILWRHRAHSIEIAEGVWKDGTWQDFDPVSIPKWRKAPGT
jgi:hypothetical protein